MTKYYRIPADHERFVSAGLELTDPALITVERSYAEGDVFTYTEVGFNMNTLGRYARHIFKTDEEWRNQERRPIIGYGAKIRHTTMNVASDPDVPVMTSIDEELDGINGLPDDVRAFIVGEMRKYLPQDPA